MLDLKLLLLGTLFVPLVGVGVIWVVAPLGDRAVRWIALLVASVSLICSTAVVFSNEAATQAELAVTDVSWLANSSVTPLDVRFHVGLDGLSLWMFGLSPLLALTAILVSWEAIRDRVALFYGMLLLLEFGCVGVFVARDIVLFYVFFEFTLIPLFFLVGVWGSEQRQYAAVKFFLFTLAGSVLTLLGLLAIVVWNANQWNGGTWTFSIPDLSTNLRLVKMLLLAKKPVLVNGKFAIKPWCAQMLTPAPVLRPANWPRVAYAASRLFSAVRLSVVVAGAGVQLRRSPLYPFPARMAAMCR